MFEFRYTIAGDVIQYGSVLTKILVELAVGGRCDDNGNDCDSAIWYSRTISHLV